METAIFDLIGLFAHTKRFFPWKGDVLIILVRVGAIKVEWGKLVTYWRCELKDKNESDDFERLRIIRNLRPILNSQAAKVKIIKVLMSSYKPFENVITIIVRRSSAISSNVRMHISKRLWRILKHNNWDIKHADVNVRIRFINIVSLWLY